ncbi:MAG: flavin reductase family protein [Betaproteobacteria bacterium]|nr:flavin reductase family protein [Betaproteobacteria bacterium]
MFFEPESRDRKVFPWDPFKGVVVPRPIGWISSMDQAGRVNLAPYSYFNGVLSRPRIVSFCSESEKDAAAFAIESGEFAWSMATWDLREQMNLTSAGLPRGESEFAHAGLATAPCRLIRPPRVAASPAAMECRVTQVLRVTDAGGRETGGVVVFGQVVGMHIDERFMKNGRFDLAAVRPIARCGYDEYTVVERIFAMERPAGGGNAYGGGEPQGRAAGG